MSIKNNNQPVADNIMRIINASGLKQLAVAKKAGYGAQAFSDMLNGRKLIRPCDISAIAEALDVEPNELFGITSNTATDAGKGA